MSSHPTSPLNTLTTGLLPPQPRPAVERVERAAPSADRQTPAVDGTNLPPVGATADGRSNHSEELAQAVKDIDSYVQTVRRELQFSVDETLGRTIITVVDGDTQEVVRQIPAEEVLALARHLRQLDDKQVDGLFLQAHA